MVDTITFGKSFYHIIPVLPYPFDEIRSYTDIESTIFLTRQNVYSGLLIHRFFAFSLWIPAFAGMTKEETILYQRGGFSALGNEA